MLHLPLKYKKEPLLTNWYRISDSKGGEIGACYGCIEESENEQNAKSICNTINDFATMIDILSEAIDTATDKDAAWIEKAESLIIKLALEEK